MCTLRITLPSVAGLSLISFALLFCLTLTGHAFLRLCEPFFFFCRFAPLLLAALAGFSFARLTARSQPPDLRGGGDPLRTAPPIHQARRALAFRMAKGQEQRRPLASLGTRLDPLSGVKVKGKGQGRARSRDKGMSALRANSVSR